MTADDLWMQGHSYLYEGKFKKAINYFNRAIQIYSPEDPIPLETIYLERGEAKSEMGDYHGAIADFDFTITRTWNSESFAGYSIALFYRGIAKADLQDENGSWADIKSYVEKRQKYLSNTLREGKPGWDSDYVSKVIDSERQMLTRYLKDDNAFVRLLIVKALELFGPHAMKSLRTLKTAKKKERNERVIESLVRLIEMLEIKGDALKILS